MNPEDFLEIDNNHLVEEIIQIVTSPKWSCPSITKEKLTNVKKLLNHLIDKEKDSFFLKKCLSFNVSSQEAFVYEHEWSHALVSYDEFICFTHSKNSFFLISLARD